MGSVFAQVYWNNQLVGDSRIGAKNSPILGLPPGDGVNPILQFGDQDEPRSDFQSNHFVFDLMNDLDRNISHLQ